MQNNVLMENLINNTLQESNKFNKTIKLFIDFCEIYFTNEKKISKFKMKEILIKQMYYQCLPQYHSSI